jgi:hypothetical protein
VLFVSDRLIFFEEISYDFFDFARLYYNFVCFRVLDARQIVPFDISFKYICYMGFLIKGELGLPFEKYLRMSFYPGV